MAHLDENVILATIIRWAEQQPDVRAALLTSTRAVPNAKSDILSDYDVILVLRQIGPYHTSREWLSAFGKVLAMFRDPITETLGYPSSGNVVQFDDGLKIDFTLWTIETMRQIVRMPELLPELDAGYRILLDKDQLLVDLQPPTYQAYIPSPPDEAEYQRIIEVFFLDAFYVAKYLWRGDLVAAKFIFDCDLIQEHVRPMLEWHIECEHAWSVKPGPYGRRLQMWLREDLWNELANSFCGSDLDENWTGLYRIIALMRKASIEVGSRLRYTYPEDIDRRSIAYIEKLRTLERGA